jgi:biopolymer transport protein ExbB/TolQ
MGLVTDAVETVATTANPVGAFFTSVKLYIGLAIVGILVAGFFGAKWYITSENAKITDLTKQVASQQVAIQQQALTLQQTQKDLAGIKTLTDSYNQQINQIKLNATKQTQQFNSQQYQNLVKTKPSDAETQFNTNLNQLFQDVNNVSRAQTASPASTPAAK